MIYLDFAKAFDTVDHSALLAKLRLYGVKDQLFCWFKDYLSVHKGWFLRMRLLIGLL